MSSAPQTGPIRSTTSPPSWGRRILVVDRPFQIRYALVLSAIGMVSSVVGGGSMFLLHRSLQRNLVIPESIRMELASMDGRFGAGLAAIALLTTVTLGFFGILLTHRIAGPVYAMTRYATALAAGHYPSLRSLRKHDELKDFFDLFRKSVEFLRARDIEDAFKIEEALLKLSQVARTPDTTAALNTLQALHDRKREAADLLLPADSSLGREPNLPAPAADTSAHQASVPTAIAGE